MTSPTPPSAGAPNRRLAPPHHVIRNFLAPAEASQLLDWAIANAALFEPTVVGLGAAARVDPKVRQSLGVNRFGPGKALLKQAVLARSHEIISTVAMSPFRIDDVELQLVAHCDGAHYGRHIDTATAAERSDGAVRILSGVYYLFSQPRAFFGGALRLHPFGPADPEAGFVDIDPEHNALAVFPSWAPHEVRAVSCPSGRFADSRFAVNIWLCTRPETARVG